MSVANLRELFVHELKDMYAEEQNILDALGEMAEEDSSQQLEGVFANHQQETQQHLDRLEEIFDLLDESPEAEGGKGLGGIIEEHDSFMQTEPTGDINAAYDTHVGRKVEHYEISAYENLLRMAEALELSDAVELLQANLTDERQQLDRLKTSAHNFDLTQLRE